VNTRKAYSSTVFAPVQVALGVAIAVAAAVILAVLGSPSWLIPIAVVAILAASLHVATVRLSIGDGRVLIGLGPWGLRARAFSVDDVLGAETANLGWAEVFGIGAPLHWRTTRLTVRPGPTLCLDVRGHEHIRISTANPQTARALLTSERDGGTTMSDGAHRPWFGPKRIGYGLRPQTWQGWAICLVAAAIVIALAILFG
jgi:hypothetical protein